MRRLKKYWVILGIVLPVVTSCEVAELTKFETAPAIYFHKQTSAHLPLFQNDSIGYSFFIKSDDLIEETINLIVNAMGPMSDIPRKLIIRQTNEGAVDAAVAGTHFVSFDSPEVAKEMVMPAGKVQAIIPIIVKRHESMKTKEFRLELTVAENEYFKVGIPLQSTFTIKMTSLAIKPATWDATWHYTFGVFGTKKMWFIINYVGFSDFENPQNYGSDMTTYYKFKANSALKEYNTKMGVELMEDDGQTKVEFPE